MLARSKRYVAVALFTVVLVLLVNLAWWYYYQHTETLLEQQLARRLRSVAQTSAAGLSAAAVDSLTHGNIEAYLEVNRYLDRIRLEDSLSELFILDDNYSYLATTLEEPDTLYFLAGLNGPFIDSLFYSSRHAAIVTPSYQTGAFYLKSAFAPLVDTMGITLAVLGVEASVDYFDSLVSLKENLTYATLFSLIAGFLLGFLFLLLQRNLNRAEQHLFLAQTHGYLGRMVAVVAHEIRNPLMIIRASAERLHKKSQADESRYIIEETDRLNSIVSGYLEFAKAEGQLLSGEPPEQFDLTELLASSKRHLSEKYASHELIWFGSPPSSVMPMTGHPRSLRQVILNLLINGAEACLASDRPMAIGLSADEVGNTVIIRVSDHGPGIGKKELKRLFEPFYTTRQTGSGLGLYVSRKIIEEMGGTLRLDSREATGTTAIIELPKRTTT
ncbi:MAG: HAMP domain-containing sensor histidine kinase [Candidatus Zixiibacteriota bacterium]